LRVQYPQHQSLIVNLVKKESILERNERNQTMSHLYNHIQKHTDEPVTELERKLSETSSKNDSSTVSDLTLENALKPPAAALLPDQEETSDKSDILPEDLLKSDPEGDDLKEDPEVVAGADLKDDPDDGDESSSGVYEEGQAFTPSEPATVVASSVAVSESLFSVGTSEGSSAGVLSGDAATSLESMQYSEPEESLAADKAATAVYVLDPSEAENGNTKAVPIPTESKTHKWWYIGGAVIIAIIAIIVAVVVVVTQGGSSSSDKSQVAGNGDGDGSVVKTPAPITAILPTVPPVLSPPTLSLTTGPLIPTTPPPTTIAPTTGTLTLAPIAQLTTEQFLTSVAFDGGAALQQTGTPQNQALQWLSRNAGVDDFTPYNILQRYALATLYFATGGPTSWFANMNWITDAPVCDWNNTASETFRCSSDGNNLIALDLRQNDVMGPLPTELAHANQIGLIVFAINSLTGTIPVPYFTDMPNLIYLDLFLNSLSGTIPTEIGLATDLQYIDVDSNGLGGTIPTELGNLAKLQTVWLNNNNLQGPIPTELAKMQALETIYLNGNPLLTGTVPEVICTRTTATIVVPCGLTCSCCVDNCETDSPTRSPVTLVEGADDLLTLLTTVALDGGVGLNTEGSPQRSAFQWLGSSATLDSWTDVQLIERYALATFYFATDGDRWATNTNWLTDSDVCTWFIGDEVASNGCPAGIFQYIILPENNLKGSLPIELAHLVDLLEIDLKVNLLTSIIPTEYFTDLSLRVLDLFSNQITGTLSPEFGLQKFLTYVDFDTNSLEGTIPTEVGQLEELKTMWLNNNLFIGSIPTEFSQLGKLVDLYLSSNEFTGGIPPSLCGGSVINLEANCDLSCECCTNDCGGVLRPPSPPTMAPTATAPTTLAPSSLATSRIEGLLSTVSFDGGTALATPDTPQNVAYTWLMASPSAETLPDERLVQRYALATIYYSTEGAAWNIQGSWLTEADECFWYTSEDGGPVCTDGKIDIFDLDNNNLVGTIPPELALLTSIRFIDLFNNFLTGTLPTQLGLLTDLEFVLDVDSNLLTGTLPTELGVLSKLDIMWLKKNFFVGTVPTEFGNMIGLSQLFMHENTALTGAVPSELCALNLMDLQVDCESLSCTCCTPSCPIVPRGISELLTLVSQISFDDGASLLVEGSPQREALLWLAANAQLATYQMPQLIQRYAMATLYYSTMGSNWVNQEGWLTDSDECLWFNNVTVSPCNFNGDLQFIVLDDNLLGGTIPSELALLSNSLLLIDLSSNEISSSIPTELGNLILLDWLDLYSNFLTGTIPTEIGAFTKMQVLRIFDNFLAGVIPSEVGLMPDLNNFNVALNKIEGIVPSEMGALTDLTLFSIYLNPGITGTIPSEFAQLTNLSFFYLDGTSLTGTVTAAVCSIPTLSDFWADCSEIDCPCCSTCCADGAQQTCISG
jgi:Leucine-rich repeat (LRR) protein